MKQVRGLLVVIAALCVFSRTSYASYPIDASDEERVVGGKDASITRYPFALMLFLNEFNICTASVIGEFYALTAAHCLDNDVVKHQNPQIFLVGGSSTRNPIGTIFKVSYFVIHGEYNKSAIFDNDVAVMRVTTSFFTNPAIKPIMLQDGEPAASTSCTAVGWGLLTIPPNFIDTQTLQVAHYTLETAQNCANFYGELITEQMYCARYKNGRVFKGDSGGALVCGDRLHGIASFIADISTYGIDDKPEVFAKVPSHSIRRFIHLHTGI